MSPRIHVFEELVSTQDTARAMARQGAPEGTAVLARLQTGGRGRLNRPWSSGPGLDIALSFILRPRVKPQDAPLYGFLAAVAAAQAAEEMGIPEAKLKWPNDVLVNNRKLCGILSEAELRNGSISGMIIGVGFNLNSRAEDFPIELRERATSVKRETGREYPIEQAAELILIRVASLCSEVRTEGLGVVLDLWNDRWAHKGATVVVNGVEGTALRVDCTGALLVRDLSGRELWIRAGDVEPAAAREAGV